MGIEFEVVAAVVEFFNCAMTRGPRTDQGRSYVDAGAAKRMLKDRERKSCGTVRDNGRMAEVAVGTKVDSAIKNENCILLCRYKSCCDS